MTYCFDVMHQLIFTIFLSFIVRAHEFGFVSIYGYDIYLLTKKVRASCVPFSALFKICTQIDLYNKRHSQDY
jgi:hypothetical protein